MLFGSDSRFCVCNTFGKARFVVCLEKIFILFQREYPIYRRVYIIHKFGVVFRLVCEVVKEFFKFCGVVRGYYVAGADEDIDARAYCEFERVDFTEMLAYRVHFHGVGYDNAVKSHIFS